MAGCAWETEGKRRLEEWGEGIFSGAAGGHRTEACSLRWGTLGVDCAGSAFSGRRRAPQRRREQERGGEEKAAIELICV